MEQKENCIMRQQILDRVSSVTHLDTVAMEQARSRQQQLTKPAGSLGRLEDIAIQMAGITKQPLPNVKQKTVVIMAGEKRGTKKGGSADHPPPAAQIGYKFLYGGGGLTD